MKFRGRADRPAEFFLCLACSDGGLISCRLLFLRDDADPYLS